MYRHHVPRVVATSLLMLALAMLPTRAVLAETPYAAPSAKSGAKLIVREGCGTCHVIPGIRGAHGEVGPPLNGIAVRTFLAGVLPNTPQNMALWLENPQAIVPGNAMPDMHLSSQEAADIAAYLATLH